MRRVLKQTLHNFTRHVADHVHATVRNTVCVQCVLRARRPALLHVTQAVKSWHRTERS